MSNDNPVEGGLYMYCNACNLHYPLGFDYYSPFKVAEIFKNIKEVINVFKFIYKHAKICCERSLSVQYRCVMDDDYPYSSLVIDRDLDLSRMAEYEAVLAVRQVYQRKYAKNLRLSAKKLVELAKKKLLNTGEKV